MSRPFSVIWLGVAAALCGGCSFNEQQQTNHCADIPHGAVPQPLGTYACQWQNQMAAAAEQDDFVIHRYEWRGSTSDLGPFGRRHMERIAQRAALTPFPIIISESDSPELDETRRLKVTETLASLGAPVEGRVIVGRGIAEPLNGLEAPGISGGYLQGSGGLRGGGNSRFGFGQQGGNASGRGGGGGVSGGFF